MSRAQVASVIARLIVEAGGDLPEDPEDHFSDDDGSVHEHAINQLAEAGLVSGTSRSTFSPGLPVTRGQLATLLQGALHHATGVALSSDADHFADDDGSVHEGAIDALADAGIATGVLAGHYAPARPVSRAQVASFLTRTLDVVVEHGHAVPPDERQPGGGGGLPLPLP